ncbi:MAG: hypothetical protein IPI21_13750 [Propionivibrio sp.]|nr:hypothetical protein [Propionivibrio sp.]
MAIATLTIDLVAKLASLERDMGKAAQIAEKNARRMDQAFSAVGKTLATLGSVSPLALSLGLFVAWQTPATLESFLPAPETLLRNCRSCNMPRH